MTAPTVRILPATVGLVALAACAAPDGAGPSGSITGTLYEATATVLQAPGDVPRLCHIVMDSYPPQCGGPEVVGWDWEAVDAESASGTTWGEYHVVGTWDGERFTLVEPAQPADPDLSRHAAAPDFSSPCPEPAGGWRPVDPAKATFEAQEAALARAAQAPDYAGAWIDQSYLDGIDIGDDDPAAMEEVANDPTRFVLNLAFTGDLGERERWIREVWGGALCLSQAERTLLELYDIQQRVHEDLPDVLASGVDERRNVVTVTVMVVTPQLRREVEQRYGAEAVILDGWLTPVE
ncbi:MAG TPA: hypothetical protein VKY81_00055 [Natronosporangium sp.]|nr:hypothetical protein [Natronosporangium sp.]